MLYILYSILRICRDIKPQNSTDIRFGYFGNNCNCQSASRPFLLYFLKRPPFSVSRALHNIYVFKMYCVE